MKRTDGPRVDLDVETYVRQWFAMLGPPGEGAAARLDMEGVVGAILAIFGDKPVKKVPVHALELVGTFAMDAQSGALTPLAMELSQNGRFVTAVRYAAVYFDRDAANHMEPARLLTARVAILRRLGRSGARAFLRHADRVQTRDRMESVRRRRKQVLMDEPELVEDRSEVPPEIRVVLADTARVIVRKLASAAKASELNALRMTLTVRARGCCSAAARRFGLSNSAVSRVRNRLEKLMRKGAQGIGAEWHDALVREVHTALLVNN